MFIDLNNVCSSNVCNDVKSVSLAHRICRVFPVTDDVISNHRQAFYPKTNALPSSRTDSAPSYLTSNLSFSSLVNSSRNL